MEWYRKSSGVKAKTPSEWEDDEESCYDELFTTSKTGKFKTIEKGIGAGSEYVDTSRLKTIRRMAAENAKLAADGKPLKYDAKKLQDLAEAVLTDNVMDVDELFGVAIPGTELQRARKLLGDQGAKDFYTEISTFRGGKGGSDYREDMYWRVKSGQDYLNKFLEWELDKELKGTLGYEMSHW